MCCWGGVLINTATWWYRLAIDVNNAACGVFGAPTIPEAVSRVLLVIVDPMHLLGPLMLLVAVVMATLLLIQQLMRLALVDVLLILAPLAALLWILPQSQAWGRLWGRLFVATVLSQAVQVLTLRLGFNLATTCRSSPPGACRNHCLASRCWRWRSRSRI